MSVVTEGSSHAIPIFTEAQVARVVVTALERLRAPVSAVREKVIVVEFTTVAITRSREEDAVAVLLACYLITLVTVLGRSGPVAVVNQFLKLSLRRKTPIAAPVRCSSVTA